MDYCQGGELLIHSVKKGYLEEYEAYIVIK
jgi:hypothetical protein